jgi:hypothetical protein
MQSNAGRVPRVSLDLSYGLIWTPPVCKVDSAVMLQQVLAAVLFPVSYASRSLRAMMEFAKNNFISSTRSTALWSYAGLFSCGPTCRAITSESALATNEMLHISVLIDLLRKLYAHVVLLIWRVISQNRLFQELPSQSI